MRVELGALDRSHGPNIRTFEPDDVRALGAVMYHAYLGTVDYDGETLEQAAAEVVKTVEGAYGQFMPACSKVAVDGDSIVSATLITRFQDTPFVAFTFTDPAFSRRGLAQRCMQAAMSELFARGERELRLLVTLANAPAVKLYTGLGFKLESP